MINDAQLHQEKRKFSMDFPWETMTRVFTVCPWGSTGDYVNKIYGTSQECDNDETLNL